MALTYFVERGRKESGDTKKYCTTYGIVQLYRLNRVTKEVMESGKSEMMYDFVITGEAKEYDFPDTGKEMGYPVIYRWSTNPFTGIVKCKDVMLRDKDFIYEF